MKLSEFQQLDTKDQSTFLNGNKVFLSSARNRKHLFKLYYTGEFYVEETWIRPGTILASVDCFTSITRLQRYVEVLDVSSILIFSQIF